MTRRGGSTPTASPCQGCGRYGEKLGFGQGDAPQIALGYLLLAAICYGLALRGAETAAPAEAEAAEPALAVEGAPASASRG